MSPLPAAESSAYPWYVRLIFWLQTRKYGQVLGPARLWGRLPRVFLAMSAMYGALDRKSSPLDPALRSLVQVRVSQMNGCHFCTDINAASGMRRGVSVAKLAALADFRDCGIFTARERAALLHAESMTGNPPDKRETVMAGLREHFSENEIVELTALVAFQNMSSRFNSALGVPSQHFCVAGSSSDT